MSNRRRFLTSGLAVASSTWATLYCFGKERQAAFNAEDEKKHNQGEPLVVDAEEGRSVWAMGILVTVKVTAEHTKGAYSVFEDMVPPGAGPPPHTHTREDETIFVLDGTLRARLGGKQYDVKTGDFVHMPRGVEHYFKNVSDNPTKLLLTYTPGGFEEWFQIVGKPVENDSLNPPSFSRSELKEAVEAAQKFGVNFDPKQD